MDEYQLAQRAMADLKAAVVLLLRREARPMTNAEIGQSLGIYMGYSGGNVGHVSRAVLGLLAEEGVVEQVEPQGPWRTRHRRTGGGQDDDRNQSESGTAPR